MNRSIRTLFGIALLSVCVCSRAQMTIHVTDVGQADSILLEFTRAAVLIDAGGESTGDDRDKADSRPD